MKREPYKTKIEFISDKNTLTSGGLIASKVLKQTVKKQHNAQNLYNLRKMQNEKKIQQNMVVQTSETQSKRSNSTPIKQNPGTTRYRNTSKKRQYKLVQQT